MSLGLGVGVPLDLALIGKCRFSLIMLARPPLVKAADLVTASNALVSFA